MIGAALFLGSSGKMWALPPRPRLATESTEPTEIPTHSPHSCCSLPPLRFPVFIAAIQHQSTAPGVEGGTKQKGGEGVRGFRGYSILMALPGVIGNAIKVI